MLPNCPPTVKHTVCVANRYVKQHRVPLHEILHTFKIHPNKFELIRPGAEKGTHLHHLQQVSLPPRRRQSQRPQWTEVKYGCFQTDWTGGKIGAAAVLFRSGSRETGGEEYMGTEEKTYHIQSWSWLGYH